MTQIGDKIRKRRKELGLTQEELATRMGYKTKSTINKIECGKNDVTQSTIVKFSQVLDVSIAYLMGWETENNDTKINNYQLYEEVYKLLKDIQLSEVEINEIISYIKYIIVKRKDD